MRGATVIACLVLALAGTAWAQSLDSDINTAQADLKAGQQHDAFMYHNDIFPGLLFHTKLKTMYFFRDLDKVGLSAPTHMAWSEGGKVKVAKAPGKTTAALSAPWVVVWFNGGTGWDKTKFIRLGFNKSPSFDPVVGAIDVPWLIILQKPAVVTLDDKGLSLEGGSDLGYVVFMPLYGSQKLRPDVTAKWDTALPAEVVQRANDWTAISRKFPLYAKEDYQVDEAKDEIRIRNTFDYLTIEDAWKTQPALIAPVSPVVALAWMSKFRIAFDAAPTDMSMVTHWGPYWGVKGKSEYTYTVSGTLKYIDEVEVVKNFRTDTPGFDGVKKLFLDRMKTAASGGADPRSAYSIDWGMGMLGAWMRGMKYIPDDMKKQLAGYIQKENLLNGYFLSEKVYGEIPVPISPQKSVTILTVKPRSGLQTYGDDLVKQTSRMPFVVWQYGYYSGDWKTVQAKFEMVKKMYGFNLLLGWSNVGPEYTAEHAKISALQGPIGLARLGKQFSDQPTYDYGAYLLAKALINEWTWTKAAVPYIKANAPWFHNTSGEWIMHENHGYAGLQGLPMDQKTTYSEIPLVLDRFNREELQDFNDYYIRMRHKYIPNDLMDNVYVTDLGDAENLKAMYAKPLTALIAPEILKKQSHVSPGFYNYPIDLMELTAEMSYERLFPKGTTPAVWRRGLDSLSRGQSWKQMAIPVRTDWAFQGTTKNPWPYPAWYLMNPPKTDKAFNNDALPFGYIQSDLTRLPKSTRTQSAPNWNSSLAVWDLE